MKGKTPVEDIPLKLGKPKTTAAGIPAVISSAKHSLKKMGLTPHDGETNAEFHLRCKEAGRDLFFKSRKQMGMDQGKRI